MNKRPNTVVFDFGGVLLDWNPRHLYRSVFADHAEMERFLSEVTHSHWNLAQDGGRPWDEAIAEATARAPHYTREIAFFRERWIEMLKGPIEGSVAILERLHEAGVPLYGITNFAADTFAETKRMHAFLEKLNGIIVSGEEKLLKPDAAIYQLLLSRYGLVAQDCVFIDDVEKNVIGARAVGMHALLFTTPVQLAIDLKALGFPV